MSEWVTLYRGTRESAEDLQDLLEARGIESFLDDHVKMISSRHGLAERSTEVLVPPDASDRAQSVLTEWEAPQSSNVDRIARRIRGVVLLGLFLPAAWLALCYAGAEALPSPNPVRLALAWGVGVVIVAQLDERRRREYPGHAA